eukprot:scaffold328_cov130-Cylindrotheca_fusiformis.AAC.13
MKQQHSTLWFYLGASAALSSSSLSIPALAAAASIREEDWNAIVETRNQHRELQSLSCRRMAKENGVETVCQDDSSLAYCLEEENSSNGDCQYIAVDWDKLEQTKNNFQGTVEGNLELYLAETFFSCPCSNGVPDCSMSTFSEHTGNACQASSSTVEESITCSVGNDGSDKCIVVAKDDDGAEVSNYICSQAPSTTAGVTTVVCCTSDQQLQTCVASTLLYDNSIEDPNSCAVNVDGQICLCSVCGSQQSTPAISYDCSNAGRSDLVQTCPSNSSNDPVPLDDYFAAELGLPFFYIVPRTAATPTQNPTPAPVPPPPTPAPVPQTSPPTPPPTRPPTPPPTRTPTPPPTRSPTPPPTPRPTSLPSASPTALPSGAPSVAPSGSPTAPSPAPSEVPSSSPTWEYVANCPGIHYKLSRFNDGYGELKCNDYDGKFPGVAYTCSANTALVNGVVTLKLDPPDASVTRPFQRVCSSYAPNKLIFYCLDNVGADFSSFTSSVPSSLNCPSDFTMYAFPQFNLLQGVDARSQNSIRFDADMAANAFFVEFLDDESSTPTTETKDSTSSATTFTRGRHLLWTGMTTTMALMVLAII